MAIKAVVQIALGTDTPPGANMAVELEYAVKSGITPLDAIHAATANAPLTLGPQAPLSGQLKEGYEADVIAVAENSVEMSRSFRSIQILPGCGKGQAVKGPDVGPWGEDYSMGDNWS